MAPKALAASSAAASAKNVVEKFPEKLEVVGASDDGIDGMAKWMSNNEVMWALLRFEVGSGTTVRTKMLMLHFNGDETPTVKRGKFNVYHKDICKYLHDTTSIELKTVSEVTPEHIIETASKHFVVDNISGASFSIKEYLAQLAKEKEEAEKRKEEERKRLEAEAEAKRQEKLAARRESKRLAFTSAEDGLKAVVEGRLWNWILIGPDSTALPVVGGGCGSVDEMRECAMKHEDLVTFGLVRLSFGEGRLKRTKFAFVHLMGGKVPVMKRGKYNQVRPSIEATVKAHATCSVSFNDTSPEDFTLEMVIDRLKQVVVVDNEVLENADMSANAFSIEAFKAALLEEQATAAKECQEVEEEEEEEDEEDKSVEEPICPNHDKDPEEIVRLVRELRSCNWALFRPKDPSRPGASKDKDTKASKSSEETKPAWTKTSAKAKASGKAKAGSEVKPATGAKAKSKGAAKDKTDKSEKATASVDSKSQSSSGIESKPLVRRPSTASKATTSPKSEPPGEASKASKTKKDAPKAKAKASKAAGSPKEGPPAQPPVPAAAAAAAAAAAQPEDASSSNPSSQPGPKPEAKARASRSARPSTASMVATIRRKSSAIAERLLSSVATPTNGNNNNNNNNEGAAAPPPAVENGPSAARASASGPVRKSLTGTRASLAGGARPSVTGGARSSVAGGARTSVTGGPRPSVTGAAASRPSATASGTAAGAAPKSAATKRRSTAGAKARSSTLTKGASSPAVDVAADDRLEDRKLCATVLASAVEAGQLELEFDAEATRSPKAGASPTPSDGSTHPPGSPGKETLVS
mmetsp:Transcript_57465/g.125882  ORF Transcript_57465/g.125882 Transcript_57465/m.125882 type:complete len:809 (-) Transcript_57465:145-2571(-)|eukprot:CAMPEP_0206540492 /NCGR_PEP_ID=MMETSP0325_2-20121206/9023_1 /ASSEMBLY_ACC=CAM_ASM_000347 /TAXON_ID=2866 /ORGANISM="Crypthecodinium cohnii, Strain Seligo" /LENGTH=808 /DNA_ID=CAMNT_0054038197 /DNA_START=267 /DNA_END=2693 /DNA_ORIENTATION=-